MKDYPILNDKLRKKLRTNLLAVAIIALLLSVQSCSPKGYPIYRLGTPKFVPQSQPDSINEGGIGQDPNTGGIFLQWYSALAAAGYRVYRSDSTAPDGTPADFQLVGNVIASDLPNDTSMVDKSSIAVGVRYFYFIIAYSADGQLSNQSDTVDYTLIDRPVLDLPLPNATVDKSNLFFRWEDRTGGGYTVIRVKDFSLIPAKYIWVTPRFQAFGGSSTTRYFDFDSSAASLMISGHSYQWRVVRFNVDVTGRAYEGSTSIRLSFTVK